MNGTKTYQVPKTPIGSNFYISVNSKSVNSFNTNLKIRAESIQSWLCVGLDISSESLGSSSLDDLKGHAKKVVDSTRDLAAAYKPNFAFFERWGSKGFQWLEEIIDYIGDGPILIADAKRGDIGNTAKQYSKSIFDHFGFDAVTLNPYLGRDSIEPFLDRAEKGVFILCRTSNPSSGEFQNHQFDGQALYEKVAAWAGALNDKDNVGLVAGATAPEELTRIREIVPNLSLLIPGVGAQGGDLEHSVRVGNQSGVGIINVSRGICFAGDHSTSAIRSTAESYVSQMKTVLHG